MKTDNVLVMAKELAVLDGVEQQFAALVRQVVDRQRETASHKIMGKPGATAETVAMDMAVLERGLEKVTDNLLSQYPAFLEMHMKLRAAGLSADELAEFLDAMREERVQRYLRKVRALQEESTFVFRELFETMMRRAMGMG